MTMTVKQSNSYGKKYLSYVNKSLLRFDVLSAALGLSGSYYLSVGNNLLAQVFFCMANPILAGLALKNKSYPSALLFSAYEYFAFVGILKCLGVV